MPEALKHPGPWCHALAYCYPCPPRHNVEVTPPLIPLALPGSVPIVCLVLVLAVCWLRRTDDVYNQGLSLIGKIRSDSQAFGSALPTTSSVDSLRYTVMLHHAKLTALTREQAP